MSFPEALTASVCLAFMVCVLLLILSEVLKNRRLLQRIESDIRELKRRIDRQ